MGKLLSLGLAAFLLLGGTAGTQYNENTHGNTTPGFSEGGGAGGGSPYASATACWSFNDPTDLGNDDCADTYDLTLVNTPTATGGALGYNAKFTGASSQKATRAAALLGATNFTVAMWVKIDPGASAEQNFFYGGSPGAARTDVYEYVGSGITAYVGGQFVTDAGASALNARTLVVFGWDSSDGKGFLSVDAGAKSLTAAVGAATWSDTTGFAARNTSGYLTGAVGPSMIWTKALSAGEITTLYNSGKGKTCADLSGAELTNLVSCWDMSEDGGPYADSIGSNDLTAVNTPTQANGLVERSDSGMSARFNTASTQHMDLADASYHVNTSFEISYWWNTTGGVYPLSKFYDGGSNGEGIFIGEGGFIYFDDGGTTVTVPGLNGQTGGVWKHAALVYDGTQSGTDRITAYIDGSLVSDSGTAPANANSNVAKWMLSNNGGGGSSGITGSMDDVAFWPSGALTQSKVETIWNSGAGEFYASAWGDMIHNGPYYASADPIMLQPLRYPPPSSRRFYVR